MSGRGVTLIPGTIIVLTLDGTLAYVEDVQPTYAAVVALPEQLPAHQTTAVFTPGRVGAKKISPFSSADKVIEVSELSERNREFIGTYEQLRSQHGPNYVQRTAAELAAQEASVTVTKVHPTRSPRGSAKTPEDRKARRQQRKAAKVPCAKCNCLPVHVGHHNGTCTYEAPAKKERAPRESVASEPKSGNTFRVTDPDITKLQSENDKFAQGNRFYRVFLALKNLDASTGTLAQIIGAVGLDAGKPMTNPEKVTRRALKALVNAGNVEIV